MPSPESFCDVLEILNRENVRYVIVGSIAVVMHGANRDIADLDIAIDPSPAEAQRCMHALALAGFISSIALPLQLLIVARLFDQLTREIDVFFRYCIPFEELLSNSKSVVVGNQTARIAALEHLRQATRFYTSGHDNDSI